MGEAIDLEREIIVSCADDGAANSSRAVWLDNAVEGLRRSRPELSAGLPLKAWQKASLVVATVAIAFAVHLKFHSVILIALAVPFLCATVLKVYALWHGVRTRPDHVATAQPAAIVDGMMPRYTVLVPLFREADVAPDIVAALAALDYPRDRLQIILILEACDPETSEALARIDLPAHMVLLTVPTGQPQTKPRALNYAVQAATGEFVVVYDAEDIPAPDQLQRAVSAFARSPETGCLQARLNIYNAGASWLTRHFALEYMALFDWILPALHKARLPMPLGGTSNHFRRDVLKAAGWWDPFNVTEDADLGLRFARLGFAIEVLPSTTWEEAPEKFANWLPQRTRWLKGWMQTYAVHTRDLTQLWRDLGPRAFIGLHVLFAGMMLSALVHPWIYFAAAIDLSSGRFLTMPETLSGQALWWMGAVNLIAGYVLGAVLAAAAALRQGKPRLIAAVVLLPAYWLLISAAAYRALWQLIRAPHRWEKTAHSARGADLETAAPPSPDMSSRLKPAPAE